MSKEKMIFKNQTAVRLIVDTGIDYQLNPFTTAIIKAKNIDLDNPVEKNWSANILNPPGNDGLLYVDFNDTIKFDSEGKWLIWVMVTFVNGKIGYGTPSLYKVYSEGEVLP